MPKVGIDERHEIESVEEQVTESSNISRRKFLVTGSATGITLGFAIAGGGRRALANVAGIAGPPAQTQVNSWLNITSGGQITLTIGSSEMGQGSYTGLAMILAEDLMVDFTKIKTVQGEPAVGTPQTGNSIISVGSTVTWTNYWGMRNAGATAREMLVSAAMNIIGDQNRANYTVSLGVITYTPNGTQISYGLVANAAAKLPVPTNAPLIPDSEFRYIGKTQPRLDIPSKVNGTAIYGMDVRLPNQVYAVIQHAPAFGSVLSGSVPATPAGMIAVVPTQVLAGIGRGTEQTGNVNAIAVVGPNTWDTWQAALALDVNWTTPANAAQLSDAAFVSQAQAALTTNTPYSSNGPNTAPTLYQAEGNFAAATAAIAGAAKQFSATYQLPYVAHNPLENLACTVSYVPGVSIDIYVPSQFSASIPPIAAQITGLSLNQINIHTTQIGGALGRKFENDFVSQAIQVGFAIKQPVTVMWPREQFFGRDQYRPFSYVEVNAGLNSSGNIVGWSAINVSPSILTQHGYPLGPTGDSQATEGLTGLPYNRGAISMQWISHPSPIPAGFWRSVGMSVNTFVAESAIDELAALAGQDPLQYRLNMTTDPRWAGVLNAVAELGNYAAGPAPGHFFGLAAELYANSYAAVMVDLSLTNAIDYDGQASLFTINNVYIALDCYLSVNPGQINAQLVGGMVHGLNAALYGRTSFANGVAQNLNFPTNRVIRLYEMPQVATTIIPSPTQSSPNTLIGGVGELGVPCIAPAVANAYFRASGTRVRTLPFFPKATMGGINNPKVP
jgi:isoquinoline 1-oxidoreductase beta subunit